MWSSLPEVTTHKYSQTLTEAWQAHLSPRALDASTVISTFAGCGGSSLGYSMAGCRELLAVEWDANAVETFRLNFPDVPIYHGDIAALSVEECLRLASVVPGELDVLDGSPPCQGFSTAGKRRMNDARNDLFREYVRLLRGLMPRAFVMENVSGMVKGKMKLIFAECLRELKASGYRVSARLLNAMYFGVPQSRQRMIFIGVRNDLSGIPSHPAAQTRSLSVAQALGFDGYGEFVTGFSAGERESFTSPSPLVMADGFGGSGHSQYRVVSNSSYRETHKSISEPSPKSSATVPDTSLVYSVGDTPTSIFCRNAAQFKSASVNLDGACPTIDTSFNRFEVNLASSERRRFTIAEVKRLCSFPDQFQTIGTYAEQWARMGNSVPPLFMRAIAEHTRTVILAPTPQEMAAD